MNKHLIYFSIALLFCLFRFLLYPGIGEQTLNKYINGTIKKPFCYRVLTPAIIHGFVKITPEIISQNFKSNSEKDDDTPIWWSLNRFYFAFISLLAFIGFYFAFRELFREFYQNENVPIIAVACMPIMFAYCGHIYDPLQVFLFSLGTLLAYKNSKWFFPVFVFAVLNKETSVLLLWIYYIKNKNIRNTALFLLVYYVIQTMVRFYFFSNSGMFLEVQIVHNLMLLTMPLSWQLFLFVLILYGIFYHWDKKPEFIRNSFWIILPLVVMAIPFGYIDETRGYLEVYPLVVMLIYPTLCCRY